MIYLFFKDVFSKVDQLGVPGYLPEYYRNNQDGTRYPRVCALPNALMIFFCTIDIVPWGEGGGAYSFVACLSLTIDHASLSLSLIHI